MDKITSPVGAVNIPADTSPFYTPSGRYFASAADARFWTRVELERAAREAARQQQRETPADVRQRRLEAQVERAERMVSYYRSRGMRTQLRHAVTVLERSRAALNNAWLVSA